MDGFAAAKFLRQERGFKVPIIALTGNALEEKNERCKHVGVFYEYLTFCVIVKFRVDKTDLFDLRQDVFFLLLPPCFNFRYLISQN